MLDKSQLAKLKWRCHRGMLELDLFLIPFADNHLSALDQAACQQFELLLTQPDPVIFAWLMGHEAPLEKGLQDIVECILYVFSIRRQLLFKNACRFD